MKSVQEIVDLASAFYGSAVLFAAVEADVFTRIESGDLKGIREGDLPRGLRLLLDACVAEGLLEKDSSRAYSNTSASRLALVRGGAADLTKALKYNADVYPLWGRLSELVKTNQCVEPPARHLGEDAARTKAFAEAMYARATSIGRGVVGMIDLPRAREGRPMRLLDLAGGPGAFAILLAQKHPNVTCVTVDLKAISDEARKYVEKAGLSDRIECRVGDYHVDEYEKEAYDAVTIFGALHQESPHDIVEILRRAERALRPGGRVYVLDMMTDATRTAPAFSALFAVNMALTTTNGWVFSDEELKTWMREANLIPGATEKVPPPMPHWLVTAEKEAR